MIRIFILLVFIFTPLGASAKQTILIVGDSLSAAYGLKQSEGWVNLLQNKFDQEQHAIELINVSVSGQTTGNALLTLNEHLKRYQPSHVLIELGANDGLRGFPIKQIKQDLKQLVETSQATGAHVAVMEIQIPPNLGPRYTSLFTAVFSETTQKTNTTLMPFFMLAVAGNPELIQNDNLHPNLQAQPIIRDFMAKEITIWLEKTAP
ncbi:acyl-CoA thioesterase I [Pseudoalteromonas tunicata]|jgi:acyl-CoA thioesterase-1|nr:acyl-CoA thioesterase I [Pseudoalteromonas tunicata]